MLNELLHFYVQGNRYKIILNGADQTYYNIYFQTFSSAHSLRCWSAPFLLPRIVLKYLKIFNLGIGRYWLFLGIVDIAIITTQL
jgi:hypothetical protein